MLILCTTYQIPRFSFLLILQMVFYRISSPLFRVFLYWLLSRTTLRKNGDRSSLAFGLVSSSETCHVARVEESTKVSFYLRVSINSRVTMERHCRDSFLCPKKMRTLIIGFLTGFCMLTNRTASAFPDFIYIWRSST